MSENPTTDALDLTVRRLELAPGDIVIVEYRGIMTSDAAARIGGMLARRLPGVPFIVLDRHLSMSTLRPGKEALRALAQALKPFLEEEDAAASSEKAASA